MLDIFGRHTAYIVSSYAVAIAILITLAGGSLWKARLARKTLKAMKMTIKDVKVKV